MEQAYQLETLCHAIPWSKKTFYANQGKRYLNLKVVIHHQLVGFCICQFVADEASLFNIAIHPDFRRQKLAQRLIKKLLEELTAIRSPIPISTLWLEVRASNQAAMTLYHSMGFHQLTTRKNYYPTPDGQREDAIIMAHTLA